MKSTTVIIAFGGKYERDSSSPPHGWSSASRSRCLSTRMLNPLRASRRGYACSSNLLGEKHVATRSNNKCTETIKSVDKVGLNPFKLKATSINSKMAHADKLRNFPLLSFKLEKTSAAADADADNYQMIRYLQSNVQLLHGGPLVRSRKSAAAVDSDDDYAVKLAASIGAEEEEEEEEEVREFQRESTALDGVDLNLPFDRIPMEEQFKADDRSY
uniref:Uncharacterized protein n=1 Tax=Musa acuminata TaxID=4641 RepID=Q1EPI0_MUSAC|nr:hypothetical protein MA4_106O17.20 [Musa acuminata]